MKKRALHKDIYMTIRKTLPRFLSIFFIAALGVAFFSGVRVTEKDMKITADTQFDASNLMDIKVMGSMGVSKSNVDAIQKLTKSLEVEGTYSVDAICRIKGKNDEYVTEVLSKTERLNKMEVTKGRMPKNNKECLADEAFLEQYGVHVGDTVVVESGTNASIRDSLKENKLKITGAGKSSLYLSRERGSSNIGSGHISGFLVVPQENFKLETYTEAYVTAKGAKSKMAYTSAYNQTVSQLENQLQSIKKQQNIERLQEVQREANEKINENQADYDKEKKKAEDALAKAKKKLENGEKELKNSKETLSSKEKELKQGKKKLKQGWAEYYDGCKKMDEAKKQVTANEKKVKNEDTRLNSSEKQVKQQESNLQASEKALREQEQQLNQMEQVLGPDDPQIIEGKRQILKGKQQLAKGKEQLAAAKKQIRSGRTQIRTVKRQITSVKKQLQTQTVKLREAKKTLQNNEATIKRGEAQLADGKKQILKAEKELKTGKEEYLESAAKVKKELNKAKEKIQNARAEVRDMEEPKWYILNRRKTQSYVEYGEDTARIGAIGEVFPAIFFLVAALVSLTTMTRMVEEQRTQIGVLKALGYSGWDIAQKYVSYALTATLLGSAIGAIAGEKILPRIIIQAYTMMYVGLGDIKTPLEMEYTFMASAMAVGVIILAVLAACHKELKEKPAQLMRPAAPKEGKRIFLEYIGVLWKRLSFIWKATLRNLFRYKKRFFMTVFGIGGCMALLLVGFGLKDSIFAVSDNQFKKIATYHVSVELKEDASHQEENQLMQWMKDDKRILNQMKIYEASVDVEANGITKAASLIVPEEPDQISEFIHLKDRLSGQKYKMSDQGIILTEKAAALLDVGVGDFVKIKESEMKSVEAKIIAVTENYMQHKIYMTPKLYQSIYEKDSQATKIYCNTKKGVYEEKMGSDILSMEGAGSVHFTSSDVETMDDMLANLNVVVVVLIVSAGLLAFVVLYNLNNINISERRAELATIKVLGFYDIEVGKYVYRENIVLTVLGAVAGVGMGIILHRYVILTAEVDMIMFGRNIFLMSYVYSILLTLVFAVIINFIMFFQLKKIDMIESLKNTE